ncbi:MAG: hypothetical protein AMJ88_12525 [Anaerolineae bacterium SM23_ 63]|nr:MAG: hypothetical protein AMJ88_12525 [Anaerolineae bacterium SM23_ 63]HEY46092.1 hypothetical protein [Anaerolineae bacterium]
MKRIVLGSLVLILALALPTTAFAGGLYDSRVVFGGSFTLRSGETLDGDLAVLGGAVILQKGSTVEGTVAVIGGNLDANGEIEGDLVVVGGNATLGANAVLRGDVWEIGGNVSKGTARIEGDFFEGEGVVFPFDFGDFNFDFTRTFRGFPGGWVSTQTRVIGYLFQSFMLAALAVLVVIFWPKPTSRVASTVIGQPVATGGIGLLTIVVAPILLVLLMITICLIPVSIIGIIILVVAVVFGWIALGLEVGKRLGIALNQEYQPVVMAGLGTLVLSLVVNGINFIPCVGWLAPFLVGAVGLGGVVLSRFGTQTYMISAAPVTTEEAIVEVPPPDEPEKES